MVFYDVVKQLSIAAGVIGVFLLIHHMAGQMRDGSASGWTLIAGIGLPVFSLLLWMLADIGYRLAAEQRTSDESDDEPDPREQGRTTRAKPAQIERHVHPPRNPDLPCGKNPVDDPPRVQ